MKVIDVHTHVWLDHAEESRRELMEAVEAVPLEGMYVSGIGGYYPDRTDVRAINDEVLVLLKACPKARGQMYLNPRNGQGALEELARCVDLGFTGIKLWVATRADDPLNFPIYEAATERGLPILQHCFDKAVGQLAHETRPWEFAEAARRYPECTFIMAHLAGNFISGTECVVGVENAYVDMCGSYGENGMVEYAVARLGADHVLFGTDMPGCDFHHNLAKVTGARIPDEAKAMILFGNAERILS